MTPIVLRSVSELPLGSGVIELLSLPAYILRLREQPNIGLIDLVESTVHDILPW